MSVGKSEVLLGVGSNINPFSNIQRAIFCLALHTSIKRLSSFYLSKPYGFPGQEDFINGCILLETEKSPEALKFNVLRKIEDTLGRVRTANKNSPRTIDLDILLFGNRVVQKKGIRVPDPETFRRNYTLCPAQEVAGDMVNPLTGREVKEYRVDMAGLTQVSFTPSF